MKAAVLYAKWHPRKDYKPTQKDVIGKKTYLGSKVWRYPELKLEEVSKPKITKEDEVIIKIKKCGICGSDLHMSEQDKEGYVIYPGLTAFPVILGHEFSGIIEKAGKKAINVDTGKPFEKGEPVCAEEMIWCGFHCRPCRDGNPNQCKNLDEIGFNIDGSMAEYIKMRSGYCWSIENIIKNFGEKKGFELGATVEPTSVSYNAIFTVAEGFKPGDYVVVFGAGPIGLTSAALSKIGGASKVISVETIPERLKLAKEVGADYLINPKKENTIDKILDYTDNNGANMYIEAAGIPHIAWPQVEEILKDKEAVDVKCVQIGRADKGAILTLEKWIRKDKLYVAQGHSGHGNFPNVIRLMAEGLIDNSKIITKKFALENVLDAFEVGHTRKDAKILIEP